MSFTPFTIPWAEIPLPLQGAAVSKPPNNEWVLRIQNFHVLPPCRPPLTANFMQCFDGFGLVAPCKGNGISAQGIVNGVNDTLGPPTTGFYYIRAL